MAEPIATGELVVDVRLDTSAFARELKEKAWQLERVAGRLRSAALDLERKEDDVAPRTPGGPWTENRRD